MAPNNIISPAEAQQLVQRIARGYGWISQRARDASDQEALEAIAMLQESLGIAVRTLATNLYKSQARFVFELIQNAEDNDYWKASSSGTKPYIKFRVFRNKIVIDSNEDGFTAENVTAICKVGQSTKKTSGAQQYIGEKGIGFKSVFMVASKVHIQSGPFSFFFEHQRGGRDMGLVTPVWEPAKVALPDLLTRITLTLLDELDYPELLSQFDALPDTFLLFLKKLGEITIERIDSAGNISESTTFSCTHDDASRQATLSKIHRKGFEDPQPSLKHFHITRRLLKDLSLDEHRDSDTAEVVLAFPLDVEFEPTPIIGPQEVYAYLPTGYFGFSFLIQSDFVTEASRQGVMERQRNKEILDGIAETFLDAVCQFCEHPTLQYRWPRYIPLEISNPFWARLKDKIHELLKARAVLRGNSHGPLRPISQLKIIASNFKDEFGNALVADLDEEMYLATEYQEEDTAALRNLGLRLIDFGAGLARFRHDLKKSSSSSKFKSPETNDDWHTRTAKLLMKPFKNKEKYASTTILNEIRELACIPLQNGNWIAITEGAVFFPHTDGIRIPTDLGLNIVDEKSITNPTRKEFFVALGVKSASIQTIRALVLGRYSQESSSIDFETSLKDIHFLYSTHSPGTTVKLRDSTSLWVFNHRYSRIHDEEDLYFSDEDILDSDDDEDDLYVQSHEEYSFQDLMGSVLEVAPYNSALFGSYIHPEYCKQIENLPFKSGGSNLTFKAWLQDSIGILDQPRLADSKTPTQLSPIFRYIIEERPGKLLGTLKAHWDSYSAVMSTSLASKISDAVVPNTNIGSKALKETFIPSETLAIKCGEFLDIHEFPFLTLEKEPKIEGWKFLSVFDVGIEDSLDFWLQILYYCKLSKSPFRYEIYEVIQRKIWELGTSTEDINRVRDFITDNDLVLALSCEGRPPSWTFPGCCLWDAPAYMRTSRTLLPSLSHLNTSILAIFFVETLEIVDVSWPNLVNELDEIKEGSKPDMKIVQDIYLRLQRMSADLEPEELEGILNSFEDQALIYDVLSQEWTAPSACLWSQDAQIPGKSTISGQYRDLKDFFVGVLKVKIPDLRLLVEEFKRVAQSSVSIDDIKSLIWQINTFNPTIEDLHTLRGSKIFPVRKANGRVELRTRMARFSVIDRQLWADAFEGKLDYLDFSLKEVRTLQPFLAGLEIGGYLSEVVIEKSSFQGIIPEPSAKRTRDLQRRAYALSRCATHFGSPRAKNDGQDLYQLLLRAKVYETDSITGSLEHTLGGETVMINVSRTNIHIEESQESLNIYVPKDSKDQEMCYLRQLPMKLFNETMMAELDSNSTLAFDSTAVSILTAIFASSDEVVDLVLEEAGIVPVPYPDQYEEQIQQSQAEDILSSPGIYQQQNAESETASGMATPGGSNSSARSNSFSTTATSSRQASYHPNVTSPSVQVLSSPPRPSSAPVIPDTGPHPFMPENSRVEYRRLLDNIITATRNKRGAFPSQGVFNLDAILNALPVEAAREENNYDLPFGVRNENQLAHDIKVGAAGELYAFELLSRLETSLPGFGRHNWQSTIRKHVTIHENYRNMAPWRGAETADITYDDTEGEFTQLLISNGYLDRSIWAHATPKYFLEVKTTTKECATRFFLSKSQYQRMQRMKLGVQASAEVYIILRVFNLNRDTIDMRLYIDPAGMEERGELHFTPESYSVVPPASNGDN